MSVAQRDLFYRVSFADGAGPDLRCFTPPGSGTSTVPHLDLWQARLRILPTPSA